MLRLHICYCDWCVSVRDFYKQTLKCECEAKARFICVTGRDSSYALLFLLRCATKDTLCAVISHDISESDCCAFTRVKTTELIAFCCISWLFFAYFVRIAKYSGASACCVDYTELSSRVLALPLHRTDLHVSLKQLQPNMQICFSSLCVYLIWSLFLDFSLLFCFHFLYSETVSYNYGTCSWGVFMLCTLVSDTDWCTFLIKQEKKVEAKSHIDVGVIFHVASLFNSLISVLTNTFLDWFYFVFVIVLCT